MALIKKSQPLPPAALTVTIYGQPGTGKTTLALTAIKPALVDADLGAKRAINRADTIQAKTWEALVKDVESLQFGEYETVVLDSLTMLSEMAYKHVTDVLKYNPNDPRKWAGPLKRELERLITGLKIKGFDVVVVSHERQVGENDKFFAPEAMGKMKEAILQISDAVGYAYFKDGKRVIDFNQSSGTPAYYGKNPFAALGSGAVAITNGVDTGQMADFIATLKATFTTLSDEQRAAMEKEKAEQEKITAEIYALGATEIEDYAAKLRKMPKPMQQYAGPIFTARLDELGLVFDKASGTYKPKEA